MSRVFLVIGLTSVLTVVVAAAPRDAVFDGFEAPNLNLSIWDRRQLRPGSYWLDDTMSRGRQRSLAITVSPADRACGGKCERNEVRLAKRLHIPFGTDVWYSFSFLLTGDTSNRENTRWVSGQWKQQTGGSPFLAQRFEHGVFHITVQDNSCRVLVAKSSAEHIKVPNTADLNVASPHFFLRDKYLYNCKTDMKVEQSNDPVLPEPFGHWIDMTYHVRGGRHGKGLVEIWANGRFIARVTGSIGYDKAAGPMQYFKFGIYRDLMPGTGVAHFDNFRRTIGDQNPCAQASPDKNPGAEPRAHC